MTESRRPVIPIAAELPRDQLRSFRGRSHRRRRSHASRAEPAGNESARGAAAHEPGAAEGERAAAAGQRGDVAGQPHGAGRVRQR